MASPSQSPVRLPFGPLILIAAVVGVFAVGFAYTAGWFSPSRLTANKLLAALAPPDGPALGHRRNHVRGICFTGQFEANGAGSALSEAPMFASGQYPVVGRFNVGTSNIDQPDASVRVRGMGLQITAPGGQVWRAAMIDPPVFPVATPRAFYGLLVASASKEPDAMKTFAAAHPELAAFGAWAQSAPWTSSYAEERYNSLNSFVFTNASGSKSVVRWSLSPSAQPVLLSKEDLQKRDPDFLEQEIAQRIKDGPLRWTMTVTVANAEDPTDDPSKAWPQDRRSVDVGTLAVQQIEAEQDGPCRDINFDPTVLPSGISTSDDPFPAARSSAYRRSYDLRTAETKFYPQSNPEAKP
ncbi:MAG: catalase family peroxidase [Hyphomicrobiales bacterium]|nr:catalase family peroxidase [Hyphomicrobiales bacterium]MBV8662835.1 catalase family peroxidase [Hyphomicrobiales bacterium]